MRWPLTSLNIAFDKAFASFLLIRIALSLTMSITPPTLVEIIGNLLAWASIRLTGVPSLSDVNKMVSDAALYKSISFRQLVKIISSSPFAVCMNILVY